MQATKAASLTPVKSKSSAAPNAAKENQPGSLAQRVMDVTTSREKLPPPPPSTATTTTTTGQSTKSALKKQQPLVPTSTCDNSPLKSTNNVSADVHESAANQVAKKLDLISSASSSSSSTTSSRQIVEAANSERPSSGSLLMSSGSQLTAAEPSCQHPQQKQQPQQPQQNFHHHHHQHQAKHNNNTSNNNNNNVSRSLVTHSHQHPTSANSTDSGEVKTADLLSAELAAPANTLDTKPSSINGSTRQPIISLDTKVPHPSQGNFRHHQQQHEEVSYYNDTPAAATITNLLEPKQMGGSLDNNTKPRLLAAVATSQQQHHQQQQQQHHRIELKHHTHHHHNQQHASSNLMATSSSCQHLLRHNPYINDDQQVAELARCRQSSREVRHEANHDHDHDRDLDDDVDSLRYDNAQVERNLEAQRLANESQLEQQQQQQQQRARRQQMSISTSPKAKSAPATPCNVTPTAFHQSSSNCLNSLATNPNCNTMPPDMRKNISATCRVLPSSLASNNNNAEQMSEIKQANLKYLDSLSERGEKALRDKNYSQAIELLSQCIQLANQQKLLDYLKKNFKLYSHRAEAHLRLANYTEAIDDSMLARGLNPKWTKAYYLQGEAQFRIGLYADALAVFAFGLTHQDPSASPSLFEALVEAASSYSPDSFKSKFQKLKALKLDTKPFVVVGLLGQELFAMGHNEHAAIVLESALKINNMDLMTANDQSATAAAAATTPTSATTTTTTTTGNSTTTTTTTPVNQHKKFKSSVLSTISAAYCKLRDFDKAIGYMQRELDIETELEDVAGQCRVLANLGYTYFKVRQFDKSLEVHRKQLNLAMKMHLFQQASQAFNALGHVHVARNNYRDALTSHERCLLILKQLGDNYFEQFREMLAIGHIHSQEGDLKAAESNYNEALQLLKTHNKQLNASEREEMTLGSIMVNFNLAYLALKRQSYQDAEHHYRVVLKSTATLNSGVGTAATKRFLYEMRATNGLGQTCRLQKRFDEAKVWFEEQLQLAKTAKCKLGQSQALCNLGMIQQHFKNYKHAKHLFEENLKLADKSVELRAYAHSYLASTYFLMNFFNESKAHYESSLALFRDLAYSQAERKTIELNLALVQERLGGNQQLTDSSQPQHNSTNEAAMMPTTNANQTVHSKKIMTPAT